jgi:two-component system NtrC family sensor kinase
VSKKRHNPTSDVNRLLELNQMLEEKVIERTTLLMRAKRTWEATFDALVDPITIVDDKLQIVRTNVSMANTSGSDIRTISGRHCYDAFLGRTEPCDACPAQKTFVTGEHAESEVSAHNSERIFRVWSHPMSTINTDDAGMRQVVCHYKDITEEKDLQAQLLQSEKMAAVGTLAGGVAHEINNPIGAIMAFSQLLMQDAKEGSTLHDFLGEIEESAKRCKKIVASLLNFSRPSRGERRSVNLAQVVEQSLFLLRTQFKRAQVTTTVEFGENLPLVVGDANQLQQVVMNLISNAWQALEDVGGGTLDITANLIPDEWVDLVVRDTGPGIPERHLDKVFDPFFTTKAEGKGTGLGLSISYGIIKDHGGTIEVDSQAGVGTTFTVRLPWPSSSEEEA